MESREEGCYKPTLSSVGKWTGHLQEQLFHLYSVGVGISPGTMRSLCFGNTRKSATAEIWCSGSMETQAPPIWLQSLSSFVSIFPCSMSKVHMCLHQSGHQPPLNRPSLYWLPAKLCLPAAVLPPLPVKVLYILKSPARISLLPKCLTASISNASL